MNSWSVDILTANRPANAYIFYIEKISLKKWTVLESWSEIADKRNEQRKIDVRGRIHQKFSQLNE